MALRVFSLSRAIKVTYNIYKYIIYYVCDYIYTYIYVCEREREKEYVLYIYIYIYIIAYMHTYMMH